MNAEEMLDSDVIFFSFYSQWEVVSPCVSFFINAVKFVEISKFGVLSKILSIYFTLCNQGNQFI